MTSSAQPARISGRVPSLDGMRAVSMLLVFLSHSGIVPITSQPAAKVLMNLGVFGLTIFFFISGYIITTLLRKEFDRSGTLNFRAFYHRRIYRLAPPFLIVLIGAYLLQAAGLLPGSTKWLSFFAQLFQMTNYLVAFVVSNGLRPTGTGLMWSLAVENHFYLIFPALFLFLVKSYSYRGVAQILIGICVLVLFWRWFGYMILDFGRPWIIHATDARIDSILAGCVMALWKNPVLDDMRPGSTTAYGLGAVFCCIIAIWIGVADLGGWELVVSFSVQSICLYVIFCGCIMHADTIWFRWLNTRIMVYLGTISYTFYLSHLIVLKMLAYNSDLPRAGIILVGFTTTLVFSALMWHYLEKPLNSRRRPTQVAKD